MKHLEGALLRYASSLTCKHCTGLERLARAKHSGLLRTLVNYERKKFYNVDTNPPRVRTRKPPGSERRA
jgi:hypothetical protein